MCQPNFFSPFLIRSLRLAARDEPAALATWLAAHHLQELEEPIRELIDILRKDDPSAVSLELTNPPSAQEKVIASTLCTCAVDPERGLAELHKSCDPETIGRVALCVQAIGLALSTHAGRLQRGWASLVGRQILEPHSFSTC